MPSDDSVPVEPSRRERLAWYAGTVLLTGVLLFFGLRLDAVSLRAPLSYDGDSLLIMPMVKATLERGSHWRIERLGYPGILELHDFPVVDHLHFAILWLLGLAIADWVVVYNLYYLLTYPLTAFTAMYAGRRLGLTLPMAAVGGLLYTFLPYHYMRGEPHYFLSAYWLVPLSWLPAIALCRGDFPFFPTEPGGGRRLVLTSRRSLLQILLAVATASAGAYYAFFACAIYAFAGVWGWVLNRSAKAAASAGALIGFVVIVGVLHHLPSVAYAKQFGRNSVAERYPEEAEIYGLKIAHLLLPVDGHNVTLLGQLKSSYYSGMRPLNNENASATLGFIGSAGLLGLFATLPFASRRGWPFGVLGPFAAFIVLFATVGGIGSLFNFFVFDQVRCVNRISIYLAFICQFTAFFALDRFLLTRTGRARKWRYPAIAGLALLGFIDQTPTAWFGTLVVTNTKREQDRFIADRKFFSDVEQELVGGPRNPLEPDAPPRVFLLPYMAFPEVPPQFDLNAYEHARGYLHTQSIVWSYGAIKNREADAWYRSVAFENVDPQNYARQIIPRIVYRGFDGVIVDSRGYFGSAADNQGLQLIRQIREFVESQTRRKVLEIQHGDKWQVFLDLRPYREYLWNLDGGRLFEEGAAREREYVALTWLKGFANLDTGSRNEFRWGYERGRCVIVNPADRTRIFKLSFRIGVDAQGEFAFELKGPGIVHRDREEGSGPLDDRFVIVKPKLEPNESKFWPGVMRTYELEVPPGRHAIDFRCEVPPYFMPGNRPAFCYFIQDAALKEVK